MVSLEDKQRDSIAWASSLLQQGKHHAAINCFKGVFQHPACIESHRLEALHGLALCYAIIGEFKLALAACRQILNANPKHAMGWCTLGVSQFGMGDVDSAIVSYNQAIDLNPEMPMAYTNRASALLELGDARGAMRDASRALEIRPDSPILKTNLALGHMRNSHGRGAFFQQALRGYEARLAFMMGEPLLRLASGICGIRWTSNRPLHGKTIVVHAEQGFGDTLQFAHLVNALVVRGASVYLIVQDALVSLLAEAIPMVMVRAWSSDLPPSDYFLPLLSLPLELSMGVQRYRRESAPLVVNVARTEYWRARLEDAKVVCTHLPIVGIAWRGNAKHVNDRNRSWSLNRMLASLPAGARYVSVQKDVTLEEQHILLNAGVLSTDVELTDFRETAALFANLDGLVAVDTSVVHLAGRLHLPTLVILPRESDWRWFRHGNQSPWYPRTTLLRYTHQHQQDVELRQKVTTWLTQMP